MFVIIIIHYIDNCGQAMEESLCPECKTLIGGNNHILTDSNILMEINNYLE